MSKRLVALLMCAALSACHHSGSAGDSAPDRTAQRPEPGVIHLEPGAPQWAYVHTVVVAQSNLPVTLALNARLTYDEDATVRVYSPLSGRVLKVTARLGDRVKVGSALLQVDSPDLGSASADLTKARSDETQKRLEFERSKALYDAQVLARRDLESAAAAFEQASAEAKRATLRMRNLGGPVDGNEVYFLRTPITGVVADRQVNPGMELGAGVSAPLFVISDLRRIWAVAELPEQNLNLAAAGQPVSVTVDAYPAQEFAGKVLQVSPLLDPLTHRVQLLCSLENRDGRLRPEMFARVRLLAAESRSAVRVPNTALVTEGLYASVFIDEGGGVLRKRRVSVALRDRDDSFVDAGLKGGERIVTAGTLLLNSELSGDR